MTIYLSSSTFMTGMLSLVKSKSNVLAWSRNVPLVIEFEPFYESIMVRTRLTPTLMNFVEKLSGGPWAPHLYNWALIRISIRDHNAETDPFSEYTSWFHRSRYKKFNFKANKKLRSIKINSCDKKWKFKKGIGDLVIKRFKHSIERIFPWKYLVGENYLCE